MASMLEKDDSTDDDFSDNLQLAERLRINRENKIGNFRRKKNLLDEHLSSSSSGLEIRNEPPKPGTSGVYNPCNKKRQNVDKNTEHFGNPKRTCFSSRYRRSPEDFHKKKSNLCPFQEADVSSTTDNPTRKNLFADKTYEDHIHSLADGESSGYSSLKPFPKNRILNNLDGQSGKLDDYLCFQPKTPDPYEIPQLINIPDSPFQHLWREQQKPMGEQTSGYTLSYQANEIPNFYQNQSPVASDSSVVHYVDSASDEDSRPMMKNGSLKGGRQSPEVSQSHKKVLGRKVKKVLDSDDTDDEDWPIYNKSRPRLLFSSSDSEEVEKKSKKRVPKSVAASENGANLSFPTGDTAKSPRVFKCHQQGEPYRSACFDVDGCFASPPSCVYHSKSPSSRSYRNRKNSRSNAPASELSPSNFHHNRSGGAARCRSRVNVGERCTRRLSSPHPRAVPSPHPRINRSDVPKSVKGRSLTGSRSRRANLNLATSYPELFDAEDSSEVEFFTANSYSDTETSAESFGGLRISTTVMNPENNGVICEHSIKVGSSEDEISVVFSSGPGPHARNRDSRGSARTLGRRYNRGSRRHPSNPHEIISLSPDPVEQVRQLEEDERLARVLQAQFDAENRPGPQVTHPPYHYDITNAPLFDTDTELEESIDNEFDWNPPPALLPYGVLSQGARRNYRTNRFSSRINTPSVINSLIYNTRRLDRNRRRLNNHDARENISRFVETLMPTFNDTLSSEDSFEAYLGLAEWNGDVSRGLQRTEINRLPTRKYFTTGHAGSSRDVPEIVHKRTELNKECQVCLSDYENGDTLRILPCFHEFHTPCIDPWLKINNTCPVCRVVVDLGG